RFVGGSSPRTVTAADFDGDGFTDLAAALAGSVAIFLNDGDATFQPARSVPTTVGGNAVTAADLNGDGHRDFVVCGAFSPGRIAVLLGNGDATFQAPRLYTGVRDPQSLAVGDLDGYPDLAVADYFGNGVHAFLNQRDGTLFPAVRYAVGQAASG